MCLCIFLSSVRRPLPISAYRLKRKTQTPDNRQTSSHLCLYSMPMPQPHFSYAVSRHISTPLSSFLYYLLSLLAFQPSSLHPLSSIVYDYRLSIIPHYHLTWLVHIPSMVYVSSIV